MKDFQKEHVWLIILAITFVACTLWCRSQENKTADTAISSPPAITAPQKEQLALEHIDINAKYQDGVRCEYCCDPVTQIVYIVFTSYNNSGMTTMLNPETGKPMLLQEFKELYASYLVPEETEAPKS